MGTFECRCSYAVTIATMPMNEFQVQVRPAFLPEQSAPAAGVYAFSYTITVTNTISLNRGSAPYWASFGDPRTAGVTVTAKF